MNSVSKLKRLRPIDLSFGRFLSKLLRIFSSQETAKLHYYVKAMGFIRNTCVGKMFIDSSDSVEHICMSFGSGSG